MTYGICCKNCGNVVTTAMKAIGDPKNNLYEKSDEPLTPRGRVLVLCQQCGAQNWRVPATAEDLAKFEAAKKRTARAIELTRALDVDGMFKVPDDVRAAPEVKNALSHLFAPLEGETLKLAQALVLKVAKSGVVVASDVWIEMYDRAVAKAIADTKDAAKAAKGAKATA